MDVVFANGWASWLIPLAFIVVSIIANALKSRGEAKPQPRRRPQPMSEPRPVRPNPQSELEKFLEDLGVKKPEQAMPGQKPAAPLPRPQSAPPPRAAQTPLGRPPAREPFEAPPVRRPTRPQPQVSRKTYPKRPAEPPVERPVDGPVAEDVHRATVSKRHLVSTLQDRHAEAIQPSIEQKHLVSSVAGRTVVGEDLASARPAVAAVARTSTERTAMQLLVSGDTLTRSFMISEVFGPPLSQRGSRF
jgi:hypothetical protein